jgi:hypothetical protein
MESGKLVKKKSPKEISNIKTEFDEEASQTATRRMNGVNGTNPDSKVNTKD